MLTRSKSTSCSSNSTTMAPTLADVMSEIKSLKTVIHENAEKAATKQDVSELKSIIERQNVTIKSLEEKVESLENQMEILKYELDDKEPVPTSNIAALIQRSSGERREFR